MNVSQFPQKQAPRKGPSACFARKFAFLHICHACAPQMGTDQRLEQSTAGTPRGALVGAQRLALEGHSGERNGSRCAAKGCAKGAARRPVDVYAWHDHQKTHPKGNIGKQTGGEIWMQTKIGQVVFAIMEKLVWKNGMFNNECPSPAPAPAPHPQTHPWAAPPPGGPTPGRRIRCFRIVSPYRRYATVF